MSEESKDMPTGTEAVDAPEGAEKPKKSKKKLFIILGVVIVVLVAAIVGGLIWHEQPSFCNSICHTPMDTYVEGYYSGDSTLLITTHANAGKECLDCHVPEISEQLTEGMKWIQGDYVYPLESRGETIATEEFCLASGCHDETSYADLTEFSADWDFNPHATSQHGEQACSSCHKMHGQSVMYCSQCHTEAEAVMPDGWLTAAEAAEASTTE